MGIFTRFGSWLGLVERAAGDSPSGVTPPPRSAGGFISSEGALRILDVYRAVQIYQTAVAQLSLDVERDTPLPETPSLIRRPCLEMSRSAFLAETVGALRLHGNGYWLKERGHDGTVLNLTPLDPGLVFPHRHPRTGHILYAYDGRDDYTPRDIQHLKLLRRPGKLLGLGPIQAARSELAGAADVRDYGASWYQRDDVPSGVLTTDQPLGPDQHKQWKTAWTESHDGGVRVLGHGLKYEPILLKPADAQWIEAQRLTTTAIARLFGVPASLMLAVIEGNTQTYSNIEQAWIEFVRFSLMTDLREIEEAFTACLPRTQTVRFNLEALLRTDTKSRYEAHEIAIRIGLYSPEYARRIENITDDPGTPAPQAPAKEITHA